MSIPLLDEAAVIRTAPRKACRSRSSQAVLDAETTAWARPT
ncbi:MAG: hypothetical protein R3E48_01635 [Burkholderiaceae bacterium]